MDKSLPKLDELLIWDVFKKSFLKPIRMEDLHVDTMTVGNPCDFLVILNTLVEDG